MKIKNSMPYGLFVNSVESRFQSQPPMHEQAKTIKHKRKKKFHKFPASKEKVK